MDDFFPIAIYKFFIPKIGNYAIIDSPNLKYLLYPIYPVTTTWAPYARLNGERYAIFHKIPQVFSYLGAGVLLAGNPIFIRNMRVVMATIFLSDLCIHYYVSSIRPREWGK